MRTMVGLDALEARAPSAVAVGTFDGVHVGHRALIGRAVEHARAAELEAAVITWDRHPLATLRPEAAPPLLTTPERKIELLESTGIDALAVLPFDVEFSKWPPERFVAEVLVKGLNARMVFVGRDWRFGRGAAGDVALLEELGVQLGYEVEGVGLTELEGEAVSSSRVRSVVAAGDMETARALLGRPFEIEGQVVAGDDRGAALGYPTANIRLDPALVGPPRGVYAGRARALGRWYPAATNLGVNPTFGGDPETAEMRVETYLLDFAGDLYGQQVRVEFWKRLRDELTFNSAEDLIEQMGEDVRITRELTC